MREFGNAFGEAIADLRDRSGRTVADRRTSLDAPFEEKPPAKGPDRHGQLYRSLADKLQRELGTPRDLPATLDRDDEWDLLDAYYSKEVLGKVSRIVRRVSGLQTLDIQGIPNEKTRRYFQEAHRCYVYGFPVVCAVLCRAIIESVLQEAIDVRLSLLNPKAVPPEDLDIGPEKLVCLIAQAKELGLLSSDGRLCTDNVRTAGNWAIHLPGLFSRSVGLE